MSKRQKLEETLNLPADAALSVLTQMQLSIQDLKDLYRLFWEQDKLHIYLRLVLALSPKELLYDDQFWQNAVKSEFPDEYKLFEGQLPKYFGRSNLPVRNSPWMRYCYWLNAYYKNLTQLFKGLDNTRASRNWILEYGHRTFPKFSNLQLLYVATYFGEGPQYFYQLGIDDFMKFIRYRLQFSTNDEFYKDLEMGDRERDYYYLFSDLPRSRNFPFKVLACSVCGEVGRAKCGKCEEVVYCGRECQVEDWGEHKSACFKTQNGAKRRFAF